MTVGSCLHETVSAVRCLGIAQSETHGFRATRRSLAALPLKAESSYIRANVSQLDSQRQPSFSPAGFFFPLGADKGLWEKGAKQASHCLMWWIAGIPGGNQLTAGGAATQPGPRQGG